MVTSIIEKAPICDSMVLLGASLALRGLGWVTLGGAHVPQVETFLIFEAEGKTLMIGPSLDSTIKQVHVEDEYSFVPHGNLIGIGVNHCTRPH